MRKSLQITPIPENVDLFKALKRAGIDIDHVKKDTINIDVKDQVLVEKILGIHGFAVKEQKPLLGALEKLNEKYMGEGMFTGVDDRPKKVTSPPSLHKRKVMNFINSKVRAARKARMKTRVQHKRDKLDGRIEALDDVIRYLRKK